MNKLFTKIATAFAGMAMAVGVGVAVSSKNVSAAQAADGDSPVILDAKTLSLTSTATTAEVTKTYGGVSYKVSTGAKSYSSNGSNRFSTNAAILIGKSGTYIYNSTALPGAITKFEIFTNTGASTKVSVGVKFGTSAITSWSATGAWTQTLSSVNTVYDASSKITSGDTYFRYQVTNANNSQVQIRITYASGPAKLATPSPSYNDNNKQVTWSAITGASSYQVKVDSGSYATATSPYDVSGLTTGTQHTVYVVAKGDGTNYTDSDAGSTSFTPTAPKVLSSISVSGQTTTFEQNDTFSFGGTVTAHYTDSTSSDVTSSATFSGYNMATLGNQTVTVSYTLSGVTKTTTYSINVAAGPDVVLSTSNKPYTSTSSSNTGTEEVTLDGIQYNSYAAYIYNSYLSFNRSQSGAYLYNNTAFSKNISKIVVNYNSGGSGYFTMYEGSSAGEEGSTISPSTSGTGKITYTFSDTNQFFKFKLTTTGTYCNIVSISIYLGSAHKTLSGIAVKTSPTKTAYKSGEEFNAAGLVITATYSDASTEDIAYSSVPTAFSFSPATITTAGNVTISYGGQTCIQAVTLITVTNVTGVASAPSEVYKDGSIDPDDVTLNVTYSDSTSGTVKATSVSCDTSAIATGVTATATYSPATGTKTATFTVDVVKEPVYDTVVDELVVGDTGITGTTYGPWSGVTKTSGAVYAGNTNENNNGGIGMRADTSKDPSGIWVTSSSGVATKVEVVWTTTTSRTLHVFGKDTAYTGANHYSEMQGTQIGSFSYSSTSVDLSEECQYIALCVTGGAAGFSKIRITWKVEGADYPLTANPTLSTGAAASVAVGKNLALGVTTTPSNSDERLIVTSSNENYVTISGSGKTFTIHGVAIGSATVTVKGAKGTYQSSTTITVTAAVKTYEDKILDTTSLDITSYSTDTSISHTNDGVDYTCYNVMKTNGIQFKSSPAGYISNKEVLYSGSTTAIKSITLIMNSHNTGYITAYEGTSADPDQDVCDLVGTWDATGVNTYTFSSGMTYFKLLASGTTNVDKIIIELVDDADSVLGEARLAALAILTDLSGLCGGDDAPGYVSQSDWDTLTSDLTELNLSADAKQFLKDAERIALDNLSQGGAEIENAMAHYDACVTKFHYTPFAGITNAQPSGVANPLSLFTNNSGTEVAIIIVTSMIGLSAVGGYFFLRKRKENI